MQKSEKREVNSWRYLWSVTEKTKWNIVLLCVIQTILGISTVFYALFLKEIINRAVAGDRQGLFVCFGLFALLVFMQIMTRTVIRQVEERTRALLENRLKSRMFGSLMSGEYASVAGVHSGEWMNRLTGDTALVANGLTEILPRLLGTVVRLISAASMLIALEPKFATVILVGGFLMIVISYAFRRIMKKLHKSVREKDGELRSFLQESLGSMKVVRSYGMEEAVAMTAGTHMREHKQTRMRKASFSNLSHTGLALTMNGAMVLGICYCAYGIFVGVYDYGTFVAVMQLIGQAQMPFANISGFLPRYYAMMASCERLTEVEQWVDKHVKESMTLSEIHRFYEEDLFGLGLEQAVFAYRGEENNVLQDFSIDIKKGEFVAFTGSSGCGKSTVLEIMMCLYDLQQGSRYLLTEKGKAELTGVYQKLFAYVPQGNHLMSGTIRQVVAFAEESKADEERLRKALEIACAEFVYELEDGLDTRLGERGAGLSEGQMQRLAIARAIYSGHPVLFFDEATSALDGPTEAKVLENLRTMTDRTLLIVTHRQQALKVCDRVIEF